MSHKLKTALLVIGSVAAADAATATPVLDGSETSLQTVLGTLHMTGAAPDVNTDQLVHDELWSFEASGTASVNLIIELAGNASTNAFGLYDAANASLVPLFSGSADSMDRATVSLFGDGSLVAAYFDHGSASTIKSYGANTFTGNLFGFYLGAGGTTYYSEHWRNQGEADQMVSFRGDGDTVALPGGFPGVWGTSSYLLAWEDQAYGSSDKDFNDLVVYIESVTPVPEPGTLALLALRMIGVGIVQRRRQTRA